MIQETITTTNPPRRTVLFYLALLLVSGLGVAQNLLLTRNGIGIHIDSLSYLAMAEAMQQGGIPQLVQTGSSHFPPFYSILLALPGADPLATAIWLNALLFGLTIWLTGLLISQSTNSNPWIALTGAGVVAVSATPLQQWYLTLFSEPLFLSLALTSLWALGHALQRQQRGWLVLAGIVAGLGFATRYVGVTLVLTGGLALLLFSQRPWRGRVLDSMLFGVLAVLPVSLWLLRNTLVAGRTTTSTFAFYPMGIEDLEQFLDTLSFWLVPFGVRLLGLDAVLPGIERMIVFVLLGGVIGGLLLLRRYTPLGLRELMQQQPVLRVLLLFGMIYLAFVVFSRLFLYRNIPFDTRLLLPLFAVLVIWGNVLAYAAWHALPRAGWLGWVRRAVVLGCVLFLLAYGLRGTLWLRACYTGTGCYLGYASAAWRTSETVVAIRALEAQRPVYTNQVYAVRFLSDAIVRGLPEKMNRFTGLPNPYYMAHVEDMQQALREQGAVLAYFDEQQNIDIPTIADFEAAGVRLRLLQDTADGALYVAE